MSNPLALATWPPLAIVLSAGSVRLTSTVKFDCVLGTLVWSIVICLWHAFPDGVTVAVGVAVAVAVAVAVGVGVGGGTVGVGVGVGVGGDGVGVGVGVAVGVGVGVPPGSLKAYTLLSAAT